MNNYYGYIYKFTIITNGKIYVGRHKYKKFKLDEKYWGSGAIWKAALKKYGKENVTREILEWCTNRAQLKEREEFWIQELNATDPKVGYNILDVTFASWNSGLTKEINSILSDVSTKESATKKALFASGELTIWNKGLTKELDSRISDYSNKLSVSKKGSTWSTARRLAQPDMTGTNNPNYGHYWSDEQKLNQSNKLKGRRPPNAKYILCVETGVVYNSLTELESLLGINRKKVSNVCKGLLESYAGYHWVYVNE